MTAAQVAGGSDRSTGGSCVGRVWCTVWAEARGGGEVVQAVAAALWGRENKVIWRPVVYALCARENPFTASSAGRSCLSSASARILHSLILFSREEMSHIVS